MLNKIRRMFYRLGTFHMILYEATLQKGTRHVVSKGMKHVYFYKGLIRNSAQNLSVRGGSQYINNLELL